MNLSYKLDCFPSLHTPLFKTLALFCITSHGPRKASDFFLTLAMALPTPCPHLSVSSHAIHIPELSDKSKG